MFNQAPVEFGITRAAFISDAHVRAFCHQINPLASAENVVIRPESWCEPLQCFHNVRKMAAKNGGRIQFGFAIWEWPRVFIEAEHHAVYDPGNGSPLVDVTPALATESARTFLRDDTAEYDFTNEGYCRDNHRHALNNSPIIHEFLSVSARIVKIKNSIPGVGEVRVPARIAHELQQLEFIKANLMIQIAMQFSSRNDPCFCRSGLKFKKCHGRN